MTEDEMLLAHSEHEPKPVKVQANDYRYDGWLVSVFPKRKRQHLRCVVEDENGRLFIHNAGQITARSR